MKILITSGATEEPIDGVRYISNFSTGKTGRVLAEILQGQGMEVTLLHGKRAVLPQKEVDCVPFTSFADLDHRMQTLLQEGNYGAIIHLAAVSDFSVDSIERSDGQILKPDSRGKISSDEDMVLRLKKNYKILDRIRDYCPPKGHPLVVGFKLTDTDSSQEIEAAVLKIIQSGKVDYLVQNNLREISPDIHPAVIYDKKGRILDKSKSKKELAEKLYTLLTGEKNSYDTLS